MLNGDCHHDGFETTFCEQASLGAGVPQGQWPHGFSEHAPGAAARRLASVGAVLSPFAGLEESQRRGSVL